MFSIRFHLYGGNVHGKFEELLPPNRIVLSWRLKTWPSGHYSNVTMDLEQQVSRIIDIKTHVT